MSTRTNVRTFAQILAREQTQKITPHQVYVGAKIVVKSVRDWNIFNLCHVINSFNPVVSVKTECPSSAEGKCYNLGAGNQLMVCNPECLGGCYDETQSGCYACDNVFWDFNRNGKKGSDCRSNCPHPYLIVSVGRFHHRLDQRHHRHDSFIFCSITSGDASRKRNARTWSTFQAKRRCRSRCPIESTTRSAWRNARLILKNTKIPLVLANWLARYAKWFVLCYYKSREVISNATPMSINFWKSVSVEQEWWSLRQKQNWIFNLRTLAISRKSKTFKWHGFLRTWNPELGKYYHNFFNFCRNVLTVLSNAKPWWSPVWKNWRNLKVAPSWLEI